MLQPTNPIADPRQPAIVRSGSRLVTASGARISSSMIKRIDSSPTPPHACISPAFTRRRPQARTAPAPSCRRHPEISLVRPAIAAAAIVGVRFSRYDAG